MEGYNTEFIVVAFNVVSHLDWWMWNIFLNYYSNDDVILWFANTLYDKLGIWQANKIGDNGFNGDTSWMGAYLEACRIEWGVFQQWDRLFGWIQKSEWNLEFILPMCNLHWDTRWLSGWATNTPHHTLNNKYKTIMISKLQRKNVCGDALKLWKYISS